MVGKIEVVANWGVEFSCVDGRSVPIESSLECGLGFPYILDLTNSTGNEIYDISGGTHDIALGVVREVGGVAGESVALMNVYVAYNASLAGTFEGALLYGRRMVSKRGDLSTNDEILEIAGTSVC